jgi:hypothetical protein
MPSAVFSVIGYCVPAKKGTVKHRGKLQLKFLRLDAKIKKKWFRETSKTRFFCYP